MQVHDLLLQSAARTPGALAVCTRESNHTYEETLLPARRLARMLSSDLALPAGSRVGVLWENSIHAIVASFGVWMAGCVLVPLNTDVTGDDLLYQIRHSDTGVVICGHRYLRRLLAEQEQLDTVSAFIVEGPFARETDTPSAWYDWDSVTTEGPGIIEPVRTIDVDLASIVYTSGSTGRPKGVMLSHLNLISNARSIVSYLRLTQSDRVMMILPHFYIYGLSLVLTHFMVGGSIVQDNRFMYPNSVLETMKETGVTGFAGVPSTFALLLERSIVRDIEIPSLRYVTQAGGAMSPQMQRSVVAAFAPAKLFVMYGATEAAPRLSYLDPEDLPQKWGSIGRAVPNVDVFVSDADGQRLPPGIEGELVARGSNITCGYWKDPEATAKVIRGGLYFTGDLGKEDEDGFLYVTGRSADFIKVKGFRVSCAEIEGCLTELKAVSEAAVIGLPDRLLGEAPVAVLVAADSEQCDAESVRKSLLRRLPTHKVPTRYVFVQTLPRCAAGKIQKSLLRQQLSELPND